MPTPVRIELNAVFPARPCGRTSEEQILIHRHSGIEPDGLWADPVLALVKGVYAIGEAVREQYPGFGAVITNQNISVKKQYLVGVPVIVRGRVTTFEASSRGPVFTTDFIVANEADEPLAGMATTILLIDPSRPPPAKSERTPKEVSSVEPIATATIGRFTFTPDAVRHFEVGLPPSAHTDPEMARAAGFPKPIVAGNQVFSIIWKRFVEPRYLLPVSLNFALKRPIFWDEQVAFERRLADTSEKETLEVRRADGNAAIVCEMAGRLISN